MLILGAQNTINNRIGTWTISSQVTMLLFQTNTILYVCAQKYTILIDLNNKQSSQTEITLNTYRLSKNVHFYIN